MSTEVNLPPLPPDSAPREFGIAIRIADINARFDAATRKIIINDFNLTEEEEQQRLSDALSLHCEGDVISSIPQCECGELVGEPLKDIICMICGTPVVPLTERELQPSAWMLPPQGVSCYINPQVWTIMSRALTVNGVNLLEHLVNPMVSLPDAYSRVLRKYRDLEIPQGINYFAANFDEIIAKLSDIGAIYNAGNRLNRQDFRQFVATYKHLFFLKALPIPSKMAFVTAKTVTRTYADKNITLAMDAINTITATENSVKPLSLRTRQHRAMKANLLIAKFHQDNIATNMAKKTGSVRKHVVGTRMHFTGRAVISSLSERHRYDEIHLPWPIAVKVFDIHLTNRLYALGFSASQATAYLAEHTHQHSPLLESIFQEVLFGGDARGFPCLLNRNPTLMRGSIQRMWISRIEPNPQILSIRMSVLALKAPNADFDGDALNFMLILDKVTNAYMERLAPWTGVFDLSSARKLSANILIPAPLVTTMSAEIMDSDDKYLDSE